MQSVIFSYLNIKYQSEAVASPGLYFHPSLPRHCSGWFLHPALHGGEEHKNWANLGKSASSTSGRRAAPCGFRVAAQGVAVDLQRGCGEHLWDGLGWELSTKADDSSSG